MHLQMPPSFVALRAGRCSFLFASAAVLSLCYRLYASHTLCIISHSNDLSQIPTASDTSALPQLRLDFFSVSFRLDILSAASWLLLDFFLSNAYTKKTDTTTDNQPISPVLFNRFTKRTGHHRSISREYARITASNLQTAGKEQRSFA